MRGLQVGAHAHRKAANRVVFSRGLTRLTSAFAPTMGTVGRLARGDALCGAASISLVRLHPP
jgi:hypothetical protein